MKEVSFAETPIMSSYLLAFVITNYPYRKTERTMENGVILRTFSKAKAHETGGINYLNLTSDVVDFFSVMISI